MRQKFLIIFSVFILIFLLVGLNAVSYVKKEKTPDSESNPNRSSYNTGATGTRAFFDLLAETGRTVTRWQAPPSDLSINDKNKPAVLVIIGETRREFSDAEIEQIMRWVSNGGRLVLIDRNPLPELLKTTADWRISAAENDFPLMTDPSDIKQMTEKTNAAKPVQPTAYTQKVNAVQASRFASAINFEYLQNTSTITAAPSPAPTFSTSDKIKSEPPPKDFPVADSNRNANEKDYYESDPHIPNGKNEGTGIKTGDAPKTVQSTFPAPVAHVADQDKILLADFPFGAGQVVFLSDPFVVSNGGINLVDNAQLALNLVDFGGIIAFDEYHQGYGAGQNRLLDYFAGTPLTAVFLQLAALAAVILYTQSRRFARPLPADEPNRLSKLEYVAAMAELQQRTKAFDLAMENIYKDFRRRVSRLVGADALKTSPAELARLIAERAKLNRIELENLLANCEAIMYGEPTNKKQMLALTARLREVEAALGLQRRKRENKLN